MAGSHNSSKDAAAKKRRPRRKRERLFQDHGHEGIKVHHNPIIKRVLASAGKAIKVKVGDHVFYVNKKSALDYLRKHPEAKKYVKGAAKKRAQDPLSPLSKEEIAAFIKSKSMPLLRNRELTIKREKR